LKLWNTHEHKCAICNENINDINDYEPDHIIAHTLGGETTMNNVRILCRKCNRKEGVKARDDKKSSNN
jgi:5-methylcytosine-specific restriction endonuclease McrA